MHHIVVNFIVLAVLFIPLARFSADRALALFCWLPVVLATSAWSYEEYIGFGMVPHVLWHLSVDISYFLALTGLILIFRSFVLKRRMVILIFSTCLASLPIVAMMLFPW